MNRVEKLASAYLAINRHDWTMSNTERNLLIPPTTDKRYNWTAMWDEDGIPHHMPNFLEIEDNRGDKPSYTN